MTNKKRSIVDLLHRINPIHRKKIKEINDIKRMDAALLIERIKHMTHHLDLIIKYEWRAKKGQALRKRLANFLEEYQKRRDHLHSRLNPLIPFNKTEGADHIFVDFSHIEESPLIPLEREDAERYLVLGLLYEKVFRELKKGKGAYTLPLFLFPLRQCIPCSQNQSSSV